MLMLSFKAMADNPPLPCGTWQQGGILYQCELYQGSHPLPKNPQDCWVFTNTRPGWQYLFSYGWYYLDCRQPPEQIPLDDYAPVILVLIGSLGFLFIRKVTNHDRSTKN